MAMASLLSRQALCSIGRIALTRPLPQARYIHVTLPVLKKKRVTEIEDLFDDFEAVEESAQKQSTESTQSTSTGGRQKIKRKLTAEERQVKFNQVVDFMEPRLGRKPQEKTPHIRNAAWLQLLQLATSEEQMKEVVDLMPKWKETGRPFDGKFSEFFVRRCQELRCPQLALQVYGDFAKYNARLNLPAARQLLHSLHRLHPIEDLMTASAFFGLYDLPPVSQDLVSCSIIVEACLRHNSEHSNLIADALIPHLRDVKGQTTVNTDDRYHRENVWVQKAVHDINEALQKRSVSDLGPLNVPSSGPEAQTLST